MHITYPNYKAYTNDELRKAYFEADALYQRYSKLGWHEKAAWFYDLTNMAGREMTVRSKAKQKSR